MIRMVLDANRFSPQFVCDGCGERIAEAGDGVYLWSWEWRDGQPHLLDDGAIHQIHKGCWDAFFQQRSGLPVPVEWKELGLLPASLEATLGMDDQAHERAKQVARQVIAAEIAEDRRND